MQDVLILAPCKPQSYATKEQEYVDTHVAATSQPVERVATVERHVEEDDEEHGCSHLFGSVARNVLQFDIGYKHSF